MPKNKLIFAIFYGKMVMKMREQDEVLKKQVEAAGGIWEGVQPGIFDGWEEVAFRSPFTKHILTCPADLCNKEMIRNIINDDMRRKAISVPVLKEIIHRLEVELLNLKEIVYGEKE